MSHPSVEIVSFPPPSTRQFNIGVKMFTALLGCFFFGAMVCLGEPDDTPDAREEELYKEMGKIIMQNLGVKNPPKMTKEERRKRLPQSLIDLYNKEAKSLESKLEKRSNDTIRDFENEGLDIKDKFSHCRSISYPS